MSYEELISIGADIAPESPQHDGTAEWSQQGIDTAGAAGKLETGGTEQHAGSALQDGEGGGQAGLATTLQRTTGLQQ
jgi:hypothetical protein